MRTPPAPERRSPQSIAREIRRETACVEVAVALALVLSIATVAYVLTLDASVAARAASDLM
ncbi:MAG TPA: hypothetical protein VH765_04510 [Xanthobacteraceae bacterium]|jgi:hypothetical protein